MRKSLPVILGALVVLLIGVASFLYAKVQKSTADYAQLQVSEQESQNRYANTIDAIAEIQDSLNAISVGEPNTAMDSQGLEAERSLAGPNKGQALDRIALLRASILRNRDRIQKLEANLKSSGIKVNGLQKMIARLKQTVTEKEDLVAQLNGRVDSLTTEVTGLVAVVQETQDTLQARDLTLEEKRKELATVYYVVGSKKTLTNSGVVVAKGGVLGMGKTLQPTGAEDPTLFKPLDTDLQTVIQMDAEKPEKVKVLSAQPPTSYELRAVEGRVELHITDPAEFRKVRQLVILTA
jgi:hypothetical protein